MRIQTVAGEVGAEVDGMNVRVELTRPETIRSCGELAFGGQKGEVWFTNTGVPHAVVFVDDVESVDVKAGGHDIRFHEQFRPAGANANFVQVVGPNKIVVRTYERGVEDETLACGTGSTASALVAASRGDWGSPVTVGVRSGEELVVHFEGSAPSYDGAALEGEVTLSFRGETGLDGPLQC
jgi:diaminopimelate epimerase